MIKRAKTDLRIKHFNENFTFASKQQLKNVPFLFGAEEVLVLFINDNAKIRYPLQQLQYMKSYEI